MINNGTQTFEIDREDRRILHFAAERWAPKLGRVYSGVRGMGYRVPAMLHDRSLLEGTDTDAGLVAHLDEQADLFGENGDSAQLELAQAETRILFYALRNYRRHIEELKAADVKAGYQTIQHDADLERVGEYDEDDGSGVGGWLERLDRGWEAPDPAVDESQMALADASL